jgi:2-oxo-3-hexenedioate decarboxylase
MGAAFSTRRDVDPRVDRGMWQLLKLLGTHERAGDRHIGWKAAFRGKAAMDAVGIDRLLVGFMTEAGVCQPDAPIPLDACAAPEFDVEVAVRLGKDISAAASLDDIARAIEGVTVALELNDYSPLPVDPEPVLATNTYHRGVVWAPFAHDLTSLSALVTTVELNGDQIHHQQHEGDAAGEVAGVLKDMADLLAIGGAKLRAGEVVITGGLVPPVKLAPNDRVRAIVEPLGSLDISFS